MKIGEGIKLGKLFDIKISLDFSWLFIFFLLTWNLAVGILPTIHPNWPVALNWTVAAAASLLFFASVLAHELAHSLVAKAQGLDVKNIILFIFGGVSNIEKEPPTPKSEFLITIAGPLTSFALGIIFIVLGIISTGFTQPIAINGIQFLAGLGPLTTIFLWVGPINILVGLFNLVPGFPLDGGRLLRSLIWKLSGNLVKATYWASRMGQAVGWFFIFIGVAMVFGVEVPIFGAGLIGGLWIAFIGWFLNMAAQQSYRQTLVTSLLEGVPVERIMRDIPEISPGMSINELVKEYFIGSDRRAVMVGSKGGTSRVVTVEDVRKIPKQKWEITPAGSAAREVKSNEAVSPEESADSLIGKINDKTNQVPVMQNGHLKGVVGKKEIRRWLELNSDKLEN
jgi:Zn-dependent protease/predicted transcriptional regulator